MVIVVWLPITCAHTMVSASAWVGLTLPGMIEEPGSFSGSDQLAEAGARAGAEQADVVGDLEQAGGERVQRAVGERPSASWAASASNLFGAVTNGRPVIAATFAANSSAKPRRRVEPGADRGAALGQRIELPAAPRRSRAMPLSTCAA